ncbi:WD40 repeat-like protein [Suillus weaverae]|nr:WD40 repeat-like protein [Suillus weaverae]
MSKLTPITTPLREFTDHEGYVRAVAVFPDRRRMVTGSDDKTLRLWDLETGVVLKKLEGHRNGVLRLAVSRDGQLIASGDSDGEVIVWHGETGEPLTQPIKAHSSFITSLDFSADGKVLATGSSWGKAMKLWNTKAYRQLQGDPIRCGSDIVYRAQYSPSGELLAIATDLDIQIYNSGIRKRVASFKGHISHNKSLAWTPDGTRLLTGGDISDPTIREWDTTTWKQVGDPWAGHTGYINAIAVNPAGTLVSASYGNHVCLWRLSDHQTIAIFQHTSSTVCATFSVDGKHILSGGNKMASEWTVPNGINSKILAITTARIACIDGDLSIAEELLTQDINTDANNHTFYAHRSFVMARKHDWDCARQDAIKSINIQPSLIGYISKGIALCGKGRIPDARVAFDVASMYTDQNPETIHFLLLIKAIALFGADQHDEANLLLEELAAGCPNADTLACHVVQAYLRVQLGIKALDGTRYDEAADHFTAALNSSNLSSKLDIHEVYEDLVVLFGWDLKSLWLTAHQKWCDALLQAGKLQDAVKSYRYMMDNIDETTKASCLEWSNAFKQECSALYLTNGDAASEYDRAIDLYSAAIDLDSASDTVFANRSKAKLGEMLWEDALLDAQKVRWHLRFRSLFDFGDAQVIQLNPSFHVGYKLKHAALHGARHYDEAIKAFQTMLSKLDNAPDRETQKLRQQYLSPSDVDRAIQKAIDAQLVNAPLRVLDTTTGFLCDREAQIRTFKSSIEYSELVSSTITHRGIQMKRVEEVVKSYFQYVMLSHRWEEKEPLLQDIQDKVVYDLDPVGGITKLQSFCKTARHLKYRWAWSDTCCIDRDKDADLHVSINSMFIWYHHSALTIVYLSDVSPSSKSSALADSAWNTRGWTVQEFLAPKVILFYQKDWTLYLDNHTRNHKDSVAIMRELEHATGIDRRVVKDFRPGTKDVREKLRWASTRFTKIDEDIAYSLFGIFDVRLPVDYSEKKQKALGRLLQEIIAQSGDITALDWAGESSDFNSCLPADITSYEAPPCGPPSLSEDEIQSLVSSLRGVVALESASELYKQLDGLSTPRFAHRRLDLPCIVFPLTEARRGQGRDRDTYTYDLKSDGLHDLQITTKYKFTSFSLARPPPAWQTVLLVRPWSRHLLELPDPADDTQSVDNWSVSESLLHDSLPAQTEPIYSDSYSRALRLIVQLGQPFSAFLLARQTSGEFKRIASEHDITAEVEDMASIKYMMDIRTLTIL